MTMLSDGMLLGVGAGGITPTLDFLGASNGNTSASQTFSSVNVGTPDAARIVVVVCFASTIGSTPSLTSVTIGGVTATLIKNTVQNASTAIAYASVPTGATANVTVTYGAGMGSNKRIAVYRVVASNPVPADFKTTTITSGTSVSASLSGCSVALMATQHVLNSTVSAVSNAVVDSDYTSVEAQGQVCAKITTPGLSFGATFSVAPTGYSASLFSVGWA